MGCLAGKKCKQQPVVQLYAGYLGPGEPHRYTGIAWCFEHAKALLGEHAEHFWHELDAVEHERLGKQEEQA